MKQLNLIPHLLIGDLDSIDSADLDFLTGMGVAVQRFPTHKDETDLELALEAVLRKGFQSIRLIGGLGGRFDQSLANLMLLTRPDLKELDIRLEDGVTEAFFIHHSGVIWGKPGDTISLLPIQEPAHQIVTEGLYYPLRSETLWTDRTRGISNVMTSEQATISIGSGSVLCIHIRNKENP